MNKKASGLLAGVMCFSLFSLAQDVKHNIDKAAKNPQTKENAAKADVRLHPKEKIMDSAVASKSQNAPALGKKKKRCKKQG